MIHQILLTIQILSTFTSAHADPFSLASHFSFRGGTGWSYGSGVQKWSENYPDCGGSSQSPVALKEDEAEQASLDGLEWGNMDTTPIQMNLTNNGHTIMLTGVWHYVDYPYIDIHSTGHKFILDQVHWHWGNDANDGTEHEVEGRKGALEMHMVFRKARGEGPAMNLVYGHLFQHSTSSKVPHGIMKVANRIKEGNFKTWRSTYPQVRLSSVFRVRDLIHPWPTKVFFYNGSLTTPPCTEPVLWVVSTQMGSVGDNEMKAFRQVKDSHGENMAGNVRPLQPRNGRHYKLFTIEDED